MTDGTRIQVAGWAVAGVLLAMLPVTVHAQAPVPRQDRSWTIDVFGGGGGSLGSAKGETTVEFPVGQPFITRDGLPSRRVSSWHFGDGADLFNTVLVRFGGITGVTFPPIQPLDGALRAAVITQRRGASGGIRVGRRLTSRLSVDMWAEYRRTPVAFADGFADALVRTSNSFRTSFQTLLATAPITELTVTSSLSVTGASNHQTRIGGAIRWAVWERPSISWFVSVGTGADVRGGGTTTATLTGRYAGRLNGAAPFEETDTVTIAATQPRVVPVGTAALGVTYGLGQHFGLRADATFSISGGARTVTVHAAPAHVSGGVEGVLPSLTSPAIQFSTMPTHPTSLSGPAVTMTTFRSRGTHRQVSFTVGVFRRF